MKTFISSSSKIDFSLRELLSFTDLLKNIAKRDVTIRYKQTWLGIAWALIRPCFNILVFGVISMLITRNPDPVDNFLRVGAGVILWSFITALVSDSSNSLVANASLITKVYFPKLILPMSSIVVCLIDFAVSFLVYFVVFFILKGFPGVQLLLLPVFLMLAVLFCLGAGMFFSAMNVKYRDVNFALPFLLQFLYYVSPVFLSTAFYLEHLSPLLQKIFMLNPLVFIIDGFKFCLFGQWPAFDITYAFTSVLMIVLLLFTGFRYFLRFEKSFADYI